MRMKRGNTNVRKGSSRDHFENMYVSISEPMEKRRSLLTSIRNTLVMQEESEKVANIRDKKVEVLKEIKKEVDLINNMYQNIRKVLPNVKGIITSAEKEISVKEVKIEKEGDKIDDYIHKALSASKGGVEAKKILGEKKKKKVEGKKEKGKENNGKMSRLDRIKNNLEVIESQLKKV